MQNLLQDLKNALITDERLIINGELAKNKIVELALTLDEAFLSLLLDTPSIKKHFFRDVSSVLVFDKVDFPAFTRQSVIPKNTHPQI